MKIGLLGAGFMAKTHAAACANTPAKLAGVCSQNGADALAEQYGAKVYTSYEAMLNDVDVVDICTPTHLHYEQVMTAAGSARGPADPRPAGPDPTPRRSVAEADQGQAQD